MSLPSTQTIKGIPAIEQVGLTTQRRVVKQHRLVKGPKDYLRKRVLEKTYYNLELGLGDTRKSVSKWG